MLFIVDNEVCSSKEEECCTYNILNCKVDVNDNVRKMLELFIFMIDLFKFETRVKYWHD